MHLYLVWFLPISWYTWLVFESAMFPDSYTLCACHFQFLIPFIKHMTSMWLSTASNLYVSIWSLCMLQIPIYTYDWSAHCLILFWIPCTYACWLACCFALFQIHKHMCVYYITLMPHFWVSYTYTDLLICCLASFYTLYTYARRLVANLDWSMPCLDVYESNATLCFPCMCTYHIHCHVST